MLPSTVYIFKVARDLASAPVQGQVEAQKPSQDRSAPRIRPNRMKVAHYIPTEEELAAVKHKKRVGVLCAYWL